MKYKSYKIENYKGISTPIQLSIEKNSLIPIIGVNECGKTTILNAIYAFDYRNDRENETFKHLDDINNLYKESSVPCILSAIVEVTRDALREGLRSVTKMTVAEVEEVFRGLNMEEKLDITITRTIEWKNDSRQSRYEMTPKIRFKSGIEEEVFCREIISRLPYTLYFDDFREQFPDRIEISENVRNNWLDILEQLFKKTSPNYSVYALKDIEERRRKSILTQVSKKLNETLTAQWSNFHLDVKQSLEISIEFQKEWHIRNYEIEETGADGMSERMHMANEVERYFLSFEIIETDSKGNKHYFHVRDRSKGFYWFFNFVMKLEFNPNIAGDHNNTIYLLDEPGSYLHPYAQIKLCQKLKDLSGSDIMIYCTHSHYLLNPELIPLNKIHVATKDSQGEISLEPIYKSNHEFSLNPDTAFRIICDALYIRPFDLNINHKKILIVEGIYDYYAYSLFKGDHGFGILPGKGADSLNNFISLMIAYEVDFKVLWDYDPEGMLAHTKATQFFGEELSIRNFFLLPAGKASKRILQNLFEGADIELITTALQLEKNISFEKKISSLFFSNEKEKILDQFSQKTKNNFREVFEKLQLIKGIGKLATMEEKQPG